VLVDTRESGYNRNIPPGIAFNHCIVGVDLKNGVKHIDLTASTLAVGSIPPAVSNAFSLPIEQTTQTPTYLAPAQFQSNNIVRNSTATLQDDNSMTYVSTSRRTGAAAATIRNYYRNKSKSECIKILSETVSNDYPNVQVKDITFTDLERLDPVMEARQEYRVPDYVTEPGGFKLIRMPWVDKLTANPALSYESRKYPYILGTVNDTLRETVRVKFPPGYDLQEVPKSVAMSNALATYSVEYKHSKGELTATRTFYHKKPEVGPEEYAQYKKFYNDALKEDSRQLLLKKVK
jgi:hypothetical protein